MDSSLKQKAINIRKNILKIANSSKGPHTGTALSCVDMLTVLYFKVLHVDSFSDKNRDIFILSKGHGAMALYATLYERGYLKEDEFFSYYQNGGKLPAHLDRDTNEAIEVSSGSLGHGLPQALGFAYSKKLKKKCGFTGAKMAAKHTQDEWKTIFDSGKFDAELHGICPKAKKLKKKYTKHVYDFLYNYASDSGNVPS